MTTRDLRYADIARDIMENDPRARDIAEAMHQAWAEGFIDGKEYGILQSADVASNFEISDRTRKAINKLLESP